MTRDASHMAAYALGSLAGEEQRALEAELVASEELRLEVAVVREALAALPLASPPG